MLCHENRSQIFSFVVLDEHAFIPHPCFDGKGSKFNHTRVTNIPNRVRTRNTLHCRCVGKCVTQFFARLIGMGCRKANCRAATYVQNGFFRGGGLTAHAVKFWVGAHAFYLVLGLIAHAVNFSWDSTPERERKEHR